MYHLLVKVVGAVSLEGRHLLGIREFNIEHIAFPCHFPHINPYDKNTHHRHKIPTLHLFLTLPTLILAWKILHLVQLLFLEL